MFLSLWIYKKEDFLKLILDIYDQIFNLDT